MTTLFRGSSCFKIYSKSPLIIITIWELWWGRRHRKYYLKRLKNQDVTFLFQLWWSKESMLSSYLIKLQTSLYSLLHPKHALIFLCNTEKELKFFQKLGINARFVNQNALADENIFDIKPNSTLKYDAVYNAKLDYFKRHFLCRKLENFGLITYANSNIKKVFFSTVYKLLLPQARWLNWSAGGYQRLSYSEVAGVLNEAKVGLCLSKTEGAMYASIEYLLCGLPIVTTPSKGGRDIFFDDEFASVVKPSAALVAQETVRMTNIKVSRKKIRSVTLKKMYKFRRHFIDLLNEILKNKGSNKKFETFEKDDLHFHSPSAKDVLSSLDGIN